MSEAVTYQETLGGVNWAELKHTLARDQFDNGRSPDQYHASFANSFATVLAVATDGRIIGTARALSDGVCNAYIVDVWTHSSFRRRGIATQMLKCLLGKLAGQHVYLFTDDAAPFYRHLGFEAQSLGMGCVVGHWLQPDR